MKITKSNTKKPYIKPEVTKIIMDNNISLHLMSEGTIPDPPWVSEDRIKGNDPFKMDKA